MKLRHDLAAVLPQLRERDISKFCVFYDKYAPHLQEIAVGLYDRLSAPDQARFVVWMLKRWAKIDRINPVELGLYSATIERVKSEERAEVLHEGVRYRLRDFKSQGHDFQLLGYDWFLGVHDVLYNQYEQGDVTLAPDDVIIDAGAFLGDTAVFFHHKLGGRCQIHSFELLDENLALLVHNLERNGVADDRVVINKLALTDKTGEEIVISSRGTQGATSIFGKDDGQGDRVQTVTLDDYVVLSGLSKVDFIKMDIEGSEVMALKGARETIRHFKPKLAICLYHKWDDVITIPTLLASMGVDYHYTFKWVQLSDGWEAVLLATPNRGAAVSSVPPVSAAEPHGDPLAVLARACVKATAQVEELQREKRQAPLTAAAHLEARSTAGVP